jgi:hypothetical protein
LEIDEFGGGPGVVSEVVGDRFAGDVVFVVVTKGIEFGRGRMVRHAEVEGMEERRIFLEEGYPFRVVAVPADHGHGVLERGMKR